MRNALAAVSVPLLAIGALALAGCSAAPSCEAAPAGSTSDAVAVSGDLGGELTVDAAWPLEVASTERTQLIAGSGDPLEDGRTANITYLILNGATGEVLDDSRNISEEPVPFAYQTGTSLAGLESALHCATPGSRIVSVIAPADAFGEEGIPEIGLNAGDPLVLVADVLSVEPTPAETSDPSQTGDSTQTTPEGPTDLPAVSPWTADVPTVDLTNPDAPVVTIPDAAPQTALEVAVLEQGDGGEVPNPSTVLIDYYGVSWDTGEMFDESFSGEPISLSTNGVIPGFAAAIVGQQVGSTVIVTIPPELAYGTDPSAHALGGQTLVFLIKILGYE